MKSLILCLGKAWSILILRAENQHYLKLQCIGQSNVCFHDKQTQIVELSICIYLIPFDLQIGSLAAFLVQNTNTLVDSLIWQSKA